MLRSPRLTELRKQEEVNQSRYNPFAKDLILQDTPRSSSHEKYEIKLHSKPFRGGQTSERKGDKLCSTNELIILLEVKATLASTRPSAARYFNNTLTPKLHGNEALTILR